MLNKTKTNIGLPQTMCSTLNNKSTTELVIIVFRQSAKSWIYGDICIQNFHLERYIVRYTVGSWALKRDFRTYIPRYTSPNENFEYVYPHSNALLQFRLELERWKPHKAAHQLARFDEINDVKLFPTVYRRIYCRKILTLSNQTSLYKSKCIRIHFLCVVGPENLHTLVSVLQCNLCFQRITFLRTSHIAHESKF